MIKILNHPTDLSSERKQQIENINELLNYLVNKGYTLEEAKCIVYHVED